MTCPPSCGKHIEQDRALGEKLRRMGHRMKSFTEYAGLTTNVH
jgi:hypothetical protein